MDLQVVQELNESRLYRATNGFQAYNQDDIRTIICVCVN